MRGKDGFDYFNVKQIRITPAYAGKRTTTTVGIGIKRDHPRLCGEKQYKNMRQMCEIGSPPPMRGKGFDAYRVGVRPGITPAYAGKRVSLRYMRSLP